MSKVYVEEIAAESSLFYMAGTPWSDVEEVADLIGCTNLHDGKKFRSYMVDRKQHQAAIDFGAKVITTKGIGKYMRKSKQ